MMPLTEDDYGAQDEVPVSVTPFEPLVHSETENKAVIGFVSQNSVSNFVDIEFSELTNRYNY